MRPSSHRRPARPAAPLLITAFGQFDGGWNCSEALLSRLASDPEGLEALWGGRVAFALLPVRAETAEQELRKALDEVRPSHLLLTGQAAGRDCVSFETSARNHLHLGVADELGRVGGPGPVRAGGPERRSSTWPDLGGLIDSLRGEGVPARLSDDAGSHLCNQTLYLALEAAETAEPPFVATFMHLPLLPEQVEAGLPAALRHEACFALPLDVMAQAARRVVLHARQWAA